MILDVETHLITATDPAPRIVCMQWGTGGTGSAQMDTPSHSLAEKLLAEELEGQNLRYDMGCIGRMWPDLRLATLTGRRQCTMHTAILADIEAGYMSPRAKHSLAALAWRYLRRDISEAKNDPLSWRRRFAELEHMPLAQWPAKAREYALSDVVNEHDVLMAQASECSTHVRDNAPRVTLASIALHHATVRGIRVDTRILADIDDRAREHTARADAAVCAAGWARRKPDGKLAVSSKAIRREVEYAYTRRGDPVPYSDPSKAYPGGQIKTDEATLACSGSEILIQWALASRARKVISGYTEPWLERSAGAPVFRIHPEYHMQETGRWGSRSPSIQLFPRPTPDNAEHGGRLRSCLMPEEGHVFVWADYSQIELCAIAQLCLWRGYGDTLARAINDGVDVHALLAAELLGIPRTEYSRDNPAHRRARQEAKAGNYGRPGGLGVGGLVKISAKSENPLTPARAKAIIASHSATFPDVDAYVRGSIAGWRYGSPWALIPQPYGLDMRRLCTRATQACNTPFQGLVAVGAGLAMTELTRVCETDARSRGLPHADWWPVLYIHDEIVCTVPMADAARVRAILERIMVGSMKRCIPDVAVNVDGKVGAKWGK